MTHQNQAQAKTSSNALLMTQNGLPSDCQGWIQDFPKGGGGGGGGLTVMRGGMAMARSRVHGSFCHVCLTFVAKLYFCGILHLFIAARFLLACVFGELASYLILMRYK